MKLLVILLLFFVSLYANTSEKQTVNKAELKVTQEIDEETGVILVCVNSLAFITSDAVEAPYTQVIGLSGRPLTCSELKNKDR